MGECAPLPPPPEVIGVKGPRVLTFRFANISTQINVGALRFNPGVTFVALVVLWGFAIWCMTSEDEASAQLGLWRDWVAYRFTWFYIGSQDVWIAFALYIYFYYGDRKLCLPGKEADKPEFSDSSYFMMLFTCGVAVGMFFFGVAEPMDYYTDYSGSRYHQDPGQTDSEKAQWAITLTVFHWGLHGWIPYCIVGLTLGFASYRQGKPLTMRSTIYPLLGNRINGWLGDAMDILSIVVVVAGVCTSLGLGTRQIAQGLYRLNTNLYDPDSDSELRNTWVLIIVIITVFSCISVVSGIHNGIKFTATSAFIMANFIAFMVFCLDDPVRRPPPPSNAPSPLLLPLHTNSPHIFYVCSLRRSLASFCRCTFWTSWCRLLDTTSRMSSAWALRPTHSSARSSTATQVPSTMMW
jgi:choline-glycine betaine transporter